MQIKYKQFLKIWLYETVIMQPQKLSSYDLFSHQQLFLKDMRCCLEYAIYVRRECAGFVYRIFCPILNFSHPKYAKLSGNISQVNASVLFSNLYHCIETMQSINLNIMINQTVLIEHGSN